MGAMKYFRHILMGHEILFKIFEGPRNILFCSILKILFSKLKIKGLKHKISELAINLRRFKKDMTCEINHIHSAQQI